MLPLHSRYCWFLSGPTASGKSAVGVELAQRIGAEIISLDSMALYRSMDIGTAKPTPEQRRRVPHHLIDILQPHEEYSLAQYVVAAEDCVREIISRGRSALFVGGTPLYLKGLLRGIFEGPPADWELRHRLAEEARLEGSEMLHRRLTEVDAGAAARLHPNDTRRLIRALEVYEKTGRPISELQRQFEIGRAAEDCRVFVLDWPKPELHARIDHRVEAMFATGLVDEVRRLLGKMGTGTSPDANSASCAGCGSEPVPIFPKPLGKTAGQAVGYREVIEHLKGRSGLPETIALVQQHTRQLAKRQNTWFRSLSECRFIAVSGPVDAAETAERIVSAGTALRAAALGN